MVQKTYFTTAVSGSFTVNVANCQLSKDLNEKDFIIIVNGSVVGNAYWTKTSSVLLTYTGPNFGGVYAGEVRRHTTPARVQRLTYIDRLPLAYYEGELNRCTRRAEEASVYGVGPQSLAIDYIPINDAYDSTQWDADTIYAPTRKAVSNKIETLAPSDSPSFTGTPTAPIPITSDNSTKIATTAYTTNKTADVLSNSPVLGGNPTCATQSWNDDSTRIASTAFFQDAFIGRCLVHARRTTDLSGGDVLTLVWDNELFDTHSAYNSTNGRFTPPWNGWYWFNVGAYIEATWGSTATRANVVRLRKNGSVMMSGASLPIANGGLSEQTATYLFSISNFDTQPVYLSTSNYYDWISEGTSGRSTHKLRVPTHIRIYYIGSSLTNF